MNSMEDHLQITPPSEHDEPHLQSFLSLHADSSMYLRSGLRCSDWGNYVIARRGGEIAGAAMRSDSGMIVLQAPFAAGALAAALREDDRPLRGFLGPIGHVRTAIDALGLERTPLLKDTEEDLFALALADLSVPAPLASDALRCRVAVEADFDLLAQWRAQFRAAALNDPVDPRLHATSRSDIAALLPAGSLFILEDDGQPLACCSFNARLPDIVQVGNVWTPPASRGKGYARAVVAGALQIAARQGVARAVLTTGRKNLAAQRAYRSLGFRVHGDYATVIFDPIGGA